MSKRRLRRLVNEWASGGDHPLKTPLLRCAEANIEGSFLHLSEALQIMGQIAEYDGQRAALAIAYFAADISDGEAPCALDEMFTAVQERWEVRGV